MVLYLSRSTAFPIFNRLQEKGLLLGGYQAQKFNYNLITGLSKEMKVTAISALPYVAKPIDEVDEEYDGVRYICISHRPGAWKRRIHNVWEMIRKGREIIRQDRPKVILCDSIALAPTVAAYVLGKCFRIPTAAIVTDIPEKMVGGRMGFSGKTDAFFMKRFDSYILLCEAMNDIVNPKKKPYLVMEGSCDVDQPYRADGPFPRPRICLYGGSLWKTDAGIEILVEGFLKARLKDTELHFYGTGELEPYLAKIHQEHPEVSYCGWIKNEDLIRKETEASLLINPRPSDALYTRYSFPSKTFEYMASATPVLMTRLPGIGEEYYRYVFSIEEETSDGVCCALKEIFSGTDEELSEIGQAARAFVVGQKNNLVQSKRIIDFLAQHFRF